jgi:signal transduction histidine kinase
LKFYGTALAVGKEEMQTAGVEKSPRFSLETNGLEPFMESRQHCEELNHQIDVLRQRMELLQDNTTSGKEVFFPAEEATVKINGALALVGDDGGCARPAETPCRHELGEVLKEAGTLCHQLNQPIQCVSGYTELLLMDLPEEDPIFERLSAISTQVQRMADITRQLMDFIHRKRLTQNV